MAIQNSRSEQQEDCLAIFKPGLWQTGFFWMWRRMVPPSAGTIDE